MWLQSKLCLPITITGLFSLTGFLLFLIFNCQLIYWRQMLWTEGSCQIQNYSISSTEKYYDCDCYRARCQKCLLDQWLGDILVSFNNQEKWIQIIQEEDSESEVNMYLSQNFPLNSTVKCYWESDDVIVKEPIWNICPFPLMVMILPPLILVSIILILKRKKQWIQL